MTPPADPATSWGRTTSRWKGTNTPLGGCHALRPLVLIAFLTACDAVREITTARREGSAPATVSDSARASAPVRRNDSIPPVFKANTGAVVTPAELSALSAQLEVPVQGVTRAELRDTYAEARGDRVHEALDILAARGTPVLSATNGRVLKLFNSKAGGLMVYATDASERFILLYGHLDGYAPGLRDGMRLERGQVIGYVGTSGNAPPATPHLHFGILRGQPNVSWSRGVPINPYPLLVNER